MVLDVFLVVFVYDLVYGVLCFWVGEELNCEVINLVVNIVSMVFFDIEYFEFIKLFGFCVWFEGMVFFVFYWLDGYIVFVIGDWRNRNY